jgi:polyketide synthase 5
MPNLTPARRGVAHRATADDVRPVSLILRRGVDPDRPSPNITWTRCRPSNYGPGIKTETAIRTTSTDVATIRGWAALLCEKLALPKPPDADVRA